MVDAETKKKVDIMWSHLFRGAEVSTDITCPVPVKFYRDKETGRLKDAQEAGGRTLFEKIAEEVLEASMAYGEYIAVDDDEDGAYIDEVGEELMDAAFAIYTALDCLGFDETERNGLCRRVYEKNKSRGYYGG